MSTIEIRLVQKSEINSLQQFIHSNWKLNHILATQCELLNWQHQHGSNQLSFVAAFDQGNIVSLLGFISANPKNPIKSDIWLAIWKSLEAPQYAGLGIQVYLWLMNNLKPRSVGVAGISEEALKIYEKLRYKTAKSNQYYFALKNHSALKVHHIDSKVNSSRQITFCSEDRFVTVYEKYQAFYQTFLPEKSCDYFIHRFFKHPTYQYQCWEIENTGFIFTRLINVDSLRVLRCVDLNLNNFCKLSEVFCELAIKLDAHYVDLIEFGLEHYLEQSGLHLKQSDEEIPHYFEPYSTQNITLDIAYLCNKSNQYIFLKADSDQDRPNII